MSIPILVIFWRMNDMKHAKCILVTGADGMVGKRLVKDLISKGNGVLTFGQDKDIRNWNHWMEFHDERIPVDTIIHLAALAGVRPSFKDPELYEDVNVGGMRQMLEFSELNNSNILYASSSNAYEWWGNPYAATKKMNEIQAEDYKAIGMRFHTIWPGREDMLFMKLKRGEVEYINRGHYRDFVHVDDVVSAITALTSNFDLAIMRQRVYDIGTGNSTPVEEVAKVMNFQGEWRDANPSGERVRTKANIEALLKLGWSPKKNILNQEDHDNVS